MDGRAAVGEVLSRLGSRRSAWNAADIRGEVEHLLARAGIVTTAGVRKADITERLARRGRHISNVESHTVSTNEDHRLDPTQCEAVHVLISDAQLVVIAGAAGAGKTTVLAATRRTPAAFASVDTSAITARTSTFGCANVARAIVATDPPLDTLLMSDNTGSLQIRFTQSARRHRIGRASARHVLASADPQPVTTASGADAWRYVGTDERGRELEIIAIDIAADDSDPYLLVIRIMPTRLRR